MNQNELSLTLDRLLSTGENEVTEFKQAQNEYPTDSIGKYFSALANEANLRNVETAWFVLGVNDKTKQVTGTGYRENSKQLQSLKHQIQQDSEPGMTFRDIYELNHPQGRVILMEIPAAPQGMPISWKGHYFGRAGESIVALSMDKIDTIRNQTQFTDWSAEILPEATFDHLDQTALQKAKESFAKKKANRIPPDDVLKWSIPTFLARARLTRDGKLTRTAILLLGKAESAHLLLPQPAQMTWKLIGEERGYEHFGPPFLLNTSELYMKIRNIQMRVLPDNSLFPYELAKYDQKVILEALHNCIAHQNYLRNGKVVVTENTDKLVFENEGNFFDGKPDDYILGLNTPRRYRNPFLVQAMTELNMIDSIGHGIYDMNRRQANRFLPLPDYDLSNTEAVRLTIYGKIVDPEYSRMLIQKTDLSLEEIQALDRIQKNLSVTDAMIKHLKKAKLVEGRKPNYHVSSSVAITKSSRAKYIRTRTQTDEFYKKLIIDYIDKYGSATRQEIDDLLRQMFSELLDEHQITNKISNLIMNMKKSNQIRNSGSRKYPKWVINETGKT